MPSGVYPRHTRILRAPIVPIGPSIAYIPLTRGLYALVDSENVSWLGQRNWHALYGPNGFYAATGAHKGEDGYPGTKLMHREISKVAAHEDCDHRNGVTLNNMQKNLRSANASQNSMNSLPQRGSICGKKGVHPLPNGKFRAKIGIDGKCIHIGVYESAEAASAAYESKAKELFGDFYRKEERTA